MFFSVDKFPLSLTPFYFSKVHYFNKAKKRTGTLGTDSFHF